MNRMKDPGLNKGLENLERLRPKLIAITDRFAGFKAQSLNVRVDFPLFQRIALPVMAAKPKSPSAPSPSVESSSAKAWMGCLQHIPFCKGAFHDVPSAAHDMQVRNLALNTHFLLRAAGVPVRASLR